MSEFRHPREIFPGLTTDNEAEFLRRLNDFNGELEQRGIAQKYLAIMEELAAFYVASEPEYAAKIRRLARAELPLVAYRKHLFIPGILDDINLDLGRFDFTAWEVLQDSEIAVAELIGKGRVIVPKSENFDYVLNPAEQQFILEQALAFEHFPEPPPDQTV